MEENVITTIQMPCPVCGDLIPFDVVRHHIRGTVEDYLVPRCVWTPEGTEHLDGHQAGDE